MSGAPLQDPSPADPFSKVNVENNVARWIGVLYLTAFFIKLFDDEVTRESLKQSLVGFSFKSLSPEEAKQVVTQRQQRAAELLAPLSTALALFNLFRMKKRVDIVNSGEEPEAPLPMAVMFAVGLLVFYWQAPRCKERAPDIYTALIVLLCLASAAFDSTPVVAFLFKIIIQLVFVFTTSPTRSISGCGTVTLCRILHLLRIAFNRKTDVFDEICIELILLMAIIFMSAKVLGMDVSCAKSVVEMERSQRTEAAATSLLDVRTDAVVHLVKDLSIVNANWKVGALFGCDHHNLDGQKLQDFLVSDEDKAELEVVCRQGLKTHQPGTAKMPEMLTATLQTAENSMKFRVNMFHMPVNDGQTGAAHMLGVVRLAAKYQDQEHPSSVQQQTLSVTRVRRPEQATVKGRARDRSSSADSRGSSGSGSSGAGGARLSTHSIPEYMPLATQGSGS